ncbi:hypothetical protein J4209_00310 [Candidatus Woesearchaeota archaeon]|nr:hypothetical protein [Candidatus Woesearchaeota archaeon]
MELKTALNLLKKNSEFKEWLKENKESYFSYAFTMVEKEQERKWQMGYYNKRHDKITTFIVEKNGINVSPEEEVFKKEEAEIKKIDLTKVKASLDFALKKVESLQKRKYPNEKPVKLIIILQNIEKFGNIWNITYISQSFNVLNVKINAKNGNIIEHKIASIFEFKKHD